MKLEPFVYTEDELPDVTGLQWGELWARMRSGTFPPPRELAPGHRRWLRHEVKAWELAKERLRSWHGSRSPLHQPALPTGPARPAAAIQQKTELYRHFDADGKLLYVGISLSTTARLMSHMRGSRWAHLVASITIERFPTRYDAEFAERAAIKAEKPLHNIAHAEKP